MDWAHAIIVTMSAASVAGINTAAADCTATVNWCMTEATIGQRTIGKPRLSRGFSFAFTALIRERVVLPHGVDLHLATKILEG